MAWFSVKLPWWLGILAAVAIVSYTTATFGWWAGALALAIIFRPFWLPSFWRWVSGKGNSGE